jgi:hypothetical protein
MIPPLRGGDLQGITGLSSDDSLLVGVPTARERSFQKAPALSNIGSMSPARLSLSTVASPHCRLLFHLAAGILAENQRKLSGAAQNQASVITHRGLEVKPFCTSGRGRNIFLDIPLYRTGDSTHSPPFRGVMSDIAILRQQRATVGAPGKTLRCLNSGNRGPTAQPDQNQPKQWVRVSDYLNGTTPANH